MNSDFPVCRLCGEEIGKSQSIFFFPKMPVGHALADMQGVFHTSCLVVENESKGIGNQLAQMVEDFSRYSGDCPFFRRDGNVVSRYRIQEEKFEICDFENFAEIVIPRSLIPVLKNIEFGNFVSLGWQVLRVNNEGILILSNKYVGSVYTLRTLGINRLLALLP